MLGEIKMNILYCTFRHVVFIGELFVQVISEDQTAERLAIKYGAHVAISASSLQCLIDNPLPQFPRQWEMPVVVKDHLGPGGIVLSIFVNSE